MRGAGLLFVGACAASAHGRAVVTTAPVDRVAATPAAAAPAEPATAQPAAAAPVAPPTPGVGGTDQPVVFGLLDGDMALEEAWDRWRDGKTATYDAVFEVAVLANRARPLAMSDELMVVALGRAVELSVCDPDRLGKIRLLAIAVRGAEHPRELDAELTRLAEMGPAECAARTP